MGAQSRRVLRKPGVPLPAPPVLGSLPLYAAECLRLPRARLAASRSLCFQYGLFHFLNLLSHMVALGLPYVEHPEYGFVASQLLTG